MIIASSLAQLPRHQRLALHAELCRRELAHRNQPADLYADDPLKFITDGLRQCTEESWRNWRTTLKAAYGLPLDDEELAFFRDVSGGRDPPGKQVRELWLICGRRAGKDSIASLVAINAARFADCTALRPGERALVACFATSRLQAGIVHGYIRGTFEHTPMLRKWLTKPIDKMPVGVIELTNQVDISVTTNSYRAPRGKAIACAILDECAFWRDENSATPDVETYNAIEPGMATMAGSMIIGISSPYKQSGLLYEKWKKHYGQNNPDVLVIQAESRKYNPTIDLRSPGFIDRMVEEDPEAAAAEWFAQFRRDLADYVDRKVAEGAVMNGVHEIAPVAQTPYVAFVDPSGGARDSMTLAIAQRDGLDRGRLICLREVRAPFQPESVVAEFSETAKAYRCYSVTGDHYAGEWPREQFRKYGIEYKVSELTKGDIYREFLPHLNSGRVDLLDHPRCINQLCGLERRTVRGGRDSIDHMPNAHDDIINAAAGALVLVLMEPGVVAIPDSIMNWSRRRVA